MTQCHICTQHSNSCLNLPRPVSIVAHVYWFHPLPAVYYKSWVMTASFVFPPLSKMKVQDICAKLKLRAKAQIAKYLQSKQMLKGKHLFLSCDLDLTNSLTLECNADNVLQRLRDARGKRQVNVQSRTKGRIEGSQKNVPKTHLYGAEQQQETFHSVRCSRVM